MPVINVLPRSLAELIAAGEVVERPASVIKELLENSIDAGATNITVEIKNGGISFMRITDNGCGIARDDVRKAFLSHATSKISTEQDLESIMTLGFRGEALSSISAVSKVEILTRPSDTPIGTRYCIEGGEETILDDAGCPAGTTIIVRDLFYCTPARMKFLKKDVSEGNTIAGVVDRIALSHPEISFRFIREGKQALLTSGSNDLLSATREIFGKDFSQNLIPASGMADGISVSGYISVPHAARPNRNMQFFFINGRLVKTGTGSAAVSEAYKNSVMVGKFPSCVLNIELSPFSVDVNVHPAKTEVRFSNEKAVFNAVYSACKNALSGDFTRAQYKHKPQIDFYATLEKIPEQVSFTSVKPKEKISISKKTVTEEKTVTENEHISHLEKKSPDITHIVINSIQSVGSILKNNEESDTNHSLNKTVESDESIHYPAENVSGYVKNEEISSAVKETCDEYVFNEEDFRLIGEAFKTYIIVEYCGKLIFIDKHAAHERMIYDKLKESSTERIMQTLMVPVTVSLPKEEYSAIISNFDLLNEAGFDIEDFGNGAVIVNGCPMEILADEIPSIISEIAGRFAEKKQSVDFDKLDHIFHSVACRSAIKAGDFTTRLEMERFAKRLLAMPSIRYCPHGRPVLIEMTRRELEKNFGRI